MPDITITLTEREQALLLVNEMNDHESWSDIARKIRETQIVGVFNLEDATAEGTCKHCRQGIVRDHLGVWIDETGGDVCPIASFEPFKPNENRQHEPEPGFTDDAAG